MRWSPFLCLSMVGCGKMSVKGQRIFFRVLALTGDCPDNILMDMREVFFAIYYLHLLRKRVTINYKNSA